MVCPARVRQAGQQQADARDVHALLRLGHRAADDHVVDAAGSSPAPAPPLLQHVREHVVGATVLNMPRGALPTGVRVAATM